ncbi:MAG: Sodium-transporting ATPase subunit Q [Nitrospira sp.]|jgi:ATP synthase protein I|nr:MAG: Sodium-transporting ATPase subunit Q [Nitrospira sp.]
MNNHDELKQRISRQVDRMQKADKDRPTLLAQTAYLGTLGLLLVIPVIIGAYLGRWLDGFVEGYSMRWTLSLIIVGVAVGAINVYLFIKE